jgi:PAS domain S-box-containing protein
MLAFGGLTVAISALPIKSSSIDISTFALLTFALSVIYSFVLVKSSARQAKLKQSEEMLRSKTRELDRIFNNLPFKIAYKDLHNRYIRVNQGFADSLNTTVAELEGKSLYSIFPHDVAERYYDEDCEVFRKKEPLFGLVNEFFPFKKTEKIWLKSHKIPHFNENGDVTGLIVCGEDITAQVLSKKQLYAVEERFRKVFEYAPDGMLLFTTCTESFLKSNIAAQQMLGYTNAQLMKKCIAEIIYIEDWADFFDSLNKDIGQEGSVYKNAIRMLRSNGEILDAEVTINVMVENDGTSFKYAIFRDISELKDSERNLKNYSKQLEESNKNLKEFAYAASHDLREPLRTVISYIQLMKRKLPQESGNLEITEFMDFIEDGSRRMEKLLASLLQYSRISSNELILERFDITEAVVAACKDLSPLFQQSEAIVEWDELPEIVADRAQMITLFTNLLSNAIKYRKQETRPVIKISATANNYEYLISVSDNGIGIKEEHLEQVFALFRRLHTIDSIPGTGIGLSTCRRIMQRHSGSIWANSTFGEGTTIYISLPILEANNTGPGSNAISKRSDVRFSSRNLVTSYKHPKSQVSAKAHPHKDDLPPALSAEELQ